VEYVHYISQNKLSMQRIRCAGIKPHMKETINACKILFRLPEREFHLEDSSKDKNGIILVGIFRLV
jgi:hypothetical protein